MTPLLRVLRRDERGDDPTEEEGEEERGWRVVARGDLDGREGEAKREREKYQQRADLVAFGRGG